MPEEEKQGSMPNVESFKKMVRLLEWKRRAFLENDWKTHEYPIPRSQFNQLMLVRFSLPCNLGRIMSVTGLTPAGASLLVDKLVRQGFLKRQDDPGDRRNLLISLTPEAQEFLRHIEDRLNSYIIAYFKTCTREELRSIEEAMGIVCGILDSEESEE